MLSEIGSNFWFDPNELKPGKSIGMPSQFGVNGSDYVWLSTGRSAIKYVINTIEERSPLIRKTVVLPPFTCHTVIEPFLHAGYKVSYYSVDVSLRATASSIIETIIRKGASILLFHRYYGFDTIFEDVDLCEILRRNGVITIEDCTQCLYSTFPKSDSDYTVGSIRKWVGTPDGGFAVCKNGYFERKPTAIDVKLENAKKEASVAKYNFLFNNVGDKSDFLQKYREAEDLLDSQDNYYAISNLSSIIQGSLDFKELRRKRQMNFKRLLLSLPESSNILPLFKKLNNNEVPLYFPIIVNGRAKLQSYLVGHSIYAPVVWPKSKCQGIVCEDAEYLYNHLLCIPIDQRYDCDDIDKIISVVIDYLAFYK